MTAEIGQVWRHRQLQAPLTIGFDLLEDLRRLRAWSHQQGVHVRLRQFALGVQRQLSQQAPAPGQGDGFAMLAEVLAQCLRQCASTVIAQGMQT
ncbi:hypothetical protein D3C73_1128950 [compost metagenome]